VRGNTQEVGRSSTEARYRPTIAPKWDVLQRELLGDIDATALDYRPQPTSRREDRSFVVYILLALAFISLPMSLVGPLASKYLGTQYLLAVFTTVSVACALYTLATSRIWWAAIIEALTGPGLWLLFVAPPQSLSGWVWVFVGSLLLVCILADRIATHYSSWLAAAPQVLPEDRKTANELWRTRFARSSYRLGLAIVLAYGMGILIFSTQPITGVLWFLVLSAGLLVAALIWIKPRQSQAARHFGRALVSWLTYQRYNAVHPDYLPDGPLSTPAGAGVLLLRIVNFVLGICSFLLAFSPIMIIVAVIFLLGKISLKNLSPENISVGSVTNIALTAVIFLLVCFALYWALTTLLRGYVNHGTIFQHFRLPPGVFPSPGGSWMWRNLLTAIVLICLSTATLQLISYAPLVLMGSEKTPWVDAFGWTVDENITLTRVGNYLHGYQPVPARSVINNLSQDNFQILIRLDEDNRKRYVLGKQLADYLLSRPDAWMTLAFDRAIGGEAGGFWAILVSLLICLFLPIVVFLTTMLVVIGKELADFSERLEALKRPVCDWEGYVRRLQQSADTKVRNHLFMGVHATEDYPVLVPQKVIAEHVHLLGDSGSGKTALGLAPLLSQLIAAQDSAVVIIDLKGDMALFEAARLGAGPGRFKFFTNEIGKATYAFNPFSQFTSEFISLNQVCEVFLSALGLEHGEGYGRSYYTRVARHLLSKTIHEYPDIASFSELREKIERFTDNEKQRRDAFEMIAVVESLQSFLALNVSDAGPLLDKAISMPEVISAQEVVYFWLPPAIETASVREIAKLALHTLFTSAYQHQRLHQEKPKIWVFIDEFQHIASLNFKIIVQQARSMGLGLIMANQASSDLWTADADLRGTLEATTRLRQYFSLGSSQDREQLSKASGETLYDFYSESVGGSGYRLSSSERLGPRLMQNDLIELSDASQLSILHIKRGEDYAQYGGYPFPVISLFHITQAEYERRSQAKWPESVEGLLVAERHRSKTPDVPSQTPLLDARILADDEPPPPVSEAQAGSPWALRLSELYAKFSTTKEEDMNSSNGDSNH